MKLSEIANSMTDEQKMAVDALFEFVVKAVIQPKAESPVAVEGR